MITQGSTVAVSPLANSGAANRIPDHSPDLFHKCLPSAFKITDVAAAKSLLETKMKNDGFRWVSPGFINDAGYDPANGYSGYHVGEVNNPPKTAAELWNHDVVVCSAVIKKEGEEDHKLLYYVNHQTGQVETQKCPIDATKKL